MLVDGVYSYCYVISDLLFLSFVENDFEDFIFLELSTSSFRGYRSVVWVHKFTLLHVCGLIIQ
jgi:hypothetical protein